MKENIEKRACDVAEYIIANNATVRKASKIFKVSKSTIHTVRSICVGCIGTSQCTVKTA